MKYLRSPMPRLKRRLPTFQLKKSSNTAPQSPQSLPFLSSWNPDEERGFMSKSHGHGRSLSLQIPTVTFQSQRQPTLQEILSNSAPSPWTLSAFMAYLSQNHCLETLEFTMDAAKYEKQYQAIVTPLNPSPTNTTQPPETEHIRKLWSKLIDTYIRPNGPREVNLPSDVRDKLLSLPYETSSPDPSELVKAVKITYELMDQSVLMPFLSSVTPIQPLEHAHSAWPYNSTPSSAISSSEKFSQRFPSATRSRRNSHHIQSTDSNIPLISAISQRPSHHSLRPGCRISNFFGGSPLASSVTSEASDSSTDDEGSSPYDIVTPPSTPSTTSSSWKKMGAKLYHRKKIRSHRPSASIGHLTVPIIGDSRKRSTSSSSSTTSLGYINTPLDEEEITTSQAKKELRKKIIV
ncbi:putative regulator of g protein signaling domain protein [Erysiphe neolycopersici]|uniref:Putative regulator of g protein signaling domain protein n=1 Tax=Erysiphe neolycopersici TaxID=212602 RepID=A0A420I360_9PEZI|nr:putative regulator of g protein signaling domain protein [Erysiphe neolycopersici]